MNETFHYLLFNNLSKNWEKYVCPSEKSEFYTHWQFCAYFRIFGIRRGPEYLYQLFDVLPKQTTCEISTLGIQVYIEQ